MSKIIDFIGCAVALALVAYLGLTEGWLTVLGVTAVAVVMTVLFNLAKDYRAIVKDRQAAREIHEDEEI